MSSLFVNYQELVWPLALFIAWMVGELGQYFTKIPKISFYILLGFLLSKQQLGVLPNLQDSNILLLVNIISGLVLFEFGYRINLNWLKNNPWIMVTGLVESGLSFIIVLIVAVSFGVTTMVALQLAAVFMATSPFVIMYVINQEHSAGQVTERILHLTALNCIFAIFVFKLVLGLILFQEVADVGKAVWEGLVIFILSSILGVVSAIFLLNILKIFRTISKDRTILFALTIIIIVAIAKALFLSPAIATLVFGIVSRNLRIAMGKTQRNFGALGDLLIIVLFVAVPLNLYWHNMVTGIVLAFLLLMARIFIKTITVAVFSRLEGISWTKGILSGLALTPISIFPILLLDQNDAMNLTLNHDLVIVSGLVLFLELIGPIIVRYSLHRAKESI